MYVMNTAAAAAAAASFSFLLEGNTSG